MLVGRRTDGSARYDEHHGFLHALQTRHGHEGFDAVTIVHSGGAVLKASASHLVLVWAGPTWTSKMAGDLLPGDMLVAEGGSATVIAVHRDVVDSMFAPFTGSGTIVVNGVVVSNYAQPAVPVTLNHCAAHAALFSLRVFHRLGLSNARATSTHDDIHPFAATLLGALRVATKVFA